MAWEWLVLVGYGVALFLVAPRARTHRGFFWAEDAKGGSPSLALLTGSVVVTWIFAKSITNAANLGEKHGLLGGLAYASWYLSIPVAGLIIYRIRRRGHEGLIPFLVDAFGPTAAFLFSAAILIRLYNEIWSNTAVVGSYFGATGSVGYYCGAFGFTICVLAYTLRGGLRSSIFTDRLQLTLALVLLAWVLSWVLPAHDVRELAESSSFTLAGGLDLLLVGILQATSYPFHDPTLTDRAFVTPPRTMIRAYLLAGVFGMVLICLYSVIGVYARLEGLSGSGDVPMRVAASIHGSALIVVSALMMNSAGACLDSALSALARHISVDLAGEGGAHPSGFQGLLRPLQRLAQRDSALTLGRVTMVVFALAGNLPLFANADLLKATTISGTMVLGLAPPFLLGGLHRRAPTAFFLSFWTGLGVGIVVTAGYWPTTLQLGDGSYADLLGANAYGFAACFAGYGLGLLFECGRSKPLVDQAATGMPA
jgi:Na+/proline symporter